MKSRYPHRSLVGALGITCLLSFGSNAQRYFDEPLVVEMIVAAVVTANKCGELIPEWKPSIDKLLVESRLLRLRIPGLEESLLPHSAIRKDHERKLDAVAPNTRKQDIQMNCEEVIVTLAKPEKIFPAEFWAKYER